MEESPDRISRRRMLKRMGAAGAIAWSAPVLSSLRTPAFAQYPSVCQAPCAFECPEPAQFCNPADPTCICDQTQEGDCFCLNGAASCVGLPTCDASDECFSPKQCVGQGCCGPPADGKAGYCLAPCGIANAAHGGGATFAGV